LLCLAGGIRTASPVRSVAIEPNTWPTGWSATVQMRPEQPFRPFGRRHDCVGGESKEGTERRKHVMPGPQVLMPGHVGLRADVLDRLVEKTAFGSFPEPELPG
jgi:hypothetical protein